MVTSRWNYCFYLRTAFSLQHNSLNTHLLLNKLAKIEDLNCLPPLNFKLFFYFQLWKILGLFVLKTTSLHMQIFVKFSWDGFPWLDNYTCILDKSFLKDIAIRTDLNFDIFCCQIAKPINLLSDKFCAINLWTLSEWWIMLYHYS